MTEIGYDNLAIIIVTYNPEANLKMLLQKCNNVAGQVIVVDNNSSNSEWIKTLTVETDSSYIANSQNLGIGKAINKALAQIDRSKKNWVITFDQDSLPPDNLLEAYNYVLKYEDNVGLMGVNFNPHLNDNDCHIYHYHESLDQITSGLLHNVDIFNRAGLYNENLFIDCVDFELSLRVKKNGFKTIMVDDCFLHHTIGSPKTITLGKFQISSMNHSAFRQYFIVRNHIWLAKKYFKFFPSYIINKFYHLFIRLTKTVLIDDDKKSKIKQIHRGICDGFKSNMN